MKPFLKWAGGKYKIIDRIQNILPHGGRLVEPFCGSCAVALNTDYDDYVLADSNKDLIDLYTILTTEKQDFIDYAKSFFTPHNHTRNRYYDLRTQFNESRDCAERSALFMYLNRHGFNGLCRYNGKGAFNVPVGSYKTIYFPEQELIYFAKKLQGATFLHQSFEKTMADVCFGDVVYCDPPYVPLTATSSFTAYTQDGFDNTAQKYLCHMAEIAHNRGASVFISNHDTNITRTLYEKSTIVNFPVKRMISANANSRGNVSELIACYH